MPRYFFTFAIITNGSTIRKARNSPARKRRMRKQSALPSSSFVTALKEAGFRVAKKSSAAALR
jgi:hypothetical protein